MRPFPPQKAAAAAAHARDVEAREPRAQGPRDVGVDAALEGLEVRAVRAVVKLAAGAAVVVCGAAVGCVRVWCVVETEQRPVVGVRRAPDFGPC